MKHGAAENEIKERAALYALGALGQHEARAFEAHLEEGCPVCAAELETFESVVGLLGLTGSEQEPPADVRDRLLAGMTAAAGPAQGAGSQAQPAILSIRANEGVWERAGEGIEVKRLFVDKTKGAATSLVRMGPGTRLPKHRHPGVEQFFVLEGDCIVHGAVLGPGDYHRAEAGSIHEPTFTVGGTVFLLVAPEHYEILEAR